MANLVRYDHDGLELVIDTETGESFATISGYARMVGKDKSTISRRCDGVASGVVGTAEIPTERGLRTVAMIPESLITEWVVKDNPDLAVQLMRAGVRVFLHKLAGYTVTSTVVAPQPHDISKLVELVTEVNQKLQQQETQLLMMTVDKAKLDKLQQEREELETASQVHPGCADVLAEETDCPYPRDLTLTVAQYLKFKELEGETLYHAMTKKAAQYYRFAKKCSPPKNTKQQNIYTGSAILYLDEALKSVLNLS
jgi:hypothetical protein